MEALQIAMSIAIFLMLKPIYRQSVSQLHYFEAIRRQPDASQSDSGGRTRLLERLKVAIRSPL